MLYEVITLFHFERFGAYDKRCAARKLRRDACLSATSPLEYTCFDQFIGVAADTAATFSETT